MMARAGQTTVATDPSLLSFGALLKHYRLRAGLSQQDLAARAGLAKVTISTLERGTRKDAYPHTITVLAEALNLSAEERSALHGAVARDQAARGQRSLPIPPTPLVGRAGAVEAITRLLERAKVRLLTVIGPGGVGKTRLAQEVALEVAGFYRDGAMFVDLAPLQDAAFVPQAVARDLGVREAGVYSVEEAVIGALHSRRLLLVLDNFEHVSGAARFVARLLESCPDLVVLVTSRTRLRLRAERLYQLEPLAVPDPRSLPPLDDLATIPAVELLLARAPLPGFALDVTTGPAVAEICWRLDGIPLAIELAAARLAVLSPRELLARLDARLPVLTDGAIDLPERQHTMHDTLQWSYTLLSQTQQAILRRLAVFAGGCTWQAAVAVCGARDALPENLVLDGLQALTDASLVQRATDPEGTTRFRLLETTREYALEQLAHQGEEQTVRHAHATHFLDLALQAEPHFSGHEAQLWLARLDREHDNLRAALAWAREPGANQTERQGLGLRLAGALLQFWSVRGHLHEGRAVLDGLLDAPASSDQSEDAATARAVALRAAGVLAWSQGDAVQAEARFAASLALARQVGYSHGIPPALNNLGIVAQHGNDTEHAARLFQESLALAQALDDTISMAHSVGCLGNLAWFKRDYEQARALQEHGLALFAAAGDQFGMASTLSNLGLLAFDQGDLDLACERLEESIAIYRALGDKRNLPTPVLNLAGVLSTQGKHDQARLWYGEGLALYRETQDEWGIAHWLEERAQAAMLRDPGAEGCRRAARLFGAAAALRERIGVRRGGTERPEYGAAVDSVRAGLDAAAFDRAWAEGKAMDLEQALVYALEEKPL